MRGYEYLQFIGQNGFFANAELRFPLIEAMLTPLGVLGGLRGVFFANIGGAAFNGQAFTRSAQQATSCTRRSSATRSSTSSAPSCRSTARSRHRWTASGSSTAAPRTASASRASCSASRCTSTGRGRRCFNRDWEDAFFAAVGGSDAFRKVKFSFWIGYDF